MNKTVALMTLVSTLLFLGCDSQIGPGDTGVQSLELSLSIAPTAGSVAAKSGTGIAGLVITDGANTLDITSVGIVLREIELERVGGADCDFFDADESNESDSESEVDGESDEGEHEDDCEEFEAGPILLEPTLDNAVEHVTSIDVPEGVYSELEFDIHKVSGTSPADLVFLAQNPLFDGVSIRVEGTFNGNAFEFTQNLDEEQEVEFDPPFEVATGAGPINITLHLDLSTWFFTPTGDLVDPATANVGEPNEELVESNIRQSIGIFEDDDHDGHDDGDHDEHESDDDSD